MADCLVIIDVQKGFMNNSVTAKIPDKITELLNKKHFDRIVATQFYNKIGSPYDRMLGWRELMDAESQAVAPSVAAVSDKIIRKPVYTLSLIHIFNNDGDLVIVFDKYQIAPGSMGCPEFVIPKTLYEGKLLYN